MRLRHEEVQIVFTVDVARRLFDGNEGKQALDYVVREGYATRELLVDGDWISKPNGKVRGSRYNVNGQLSTVQDIAGIWKYIKERGYNHQSGLIKYLNNS